MNSENGDEAYFSDMSDEELQEAFAAGRLKPGLNVRVEEKVYKNNVIGLKQKLTDLASKLSWIERLDLEVKPAPISPEMQFEMNEKEKENIISLKSKTKYFNKGLQKDKIALDDFKREVIFHRMAQSAVLQGISRLKSMGVPTQRPDDYFAEMMKSDDHMQKVRKSLAAKKAGAVIAEKVSQLRRLKKLGKQIQIENKLKQQSEKKKMLEEVKKYRKGIRKDLDFLDGKKHKKPGISKKQQMKNDRYGFGGKKRGSKRNTKESSAALGGSFKKGKGKGKNKNNNNKRPGRNKRLKNKSRK